MKTFAEKYSPVTLDDIISQDHVKSMLKAYVAKGSVPNMIMYGPPGTGKTSTVRALCHELYGSSSDKTMTLELNGSDDRGINVIRNHIKNFSKLKNLKFPHLPKIIILDEADSLTFDAQFALRRVIEKFTKNVRFCLICNYISKLIPALHSRCVVIEFEPVGVSEVVAHTKKILTKEGIGFTKGVLETAVQMNGGDVRSTLNFFQSFSGGSMTMDGIFRQRFMTGEKSFKVLRDIMRETTPDFTKVLATVTRIYDADRMKLESLLNLCTYIGMRERDYPFLVALAEIEYAYYRSKNSFERIFMYAICVCFTRKARLSCSMEQGAAA